MKEFLASILKPIVHNPDLVVIEETTDDMGLLFSVSVSPRDMGIVIGKKGEMANAVRIIMRSVGAKDGTKVSVRFLEPAGTHFIRPSND